MPTVTMTGCERVNRMLARQDHDRVPRHDTYWPETIARWQREGLLSDHSVPPQVSWATYQAIVGLVQHYGNY